MSEKLYEVIKIDNLKDMLNKTKKYMVKNYLKDFKQRNFYLNMDLLIK